MNTLIEVENLRAFSRDNVPLTPVVSFDLAEGEVLFLRGENGAGKSTLLKTLLGLHKKYEGSFKLHIPSTQIQYLPQLGNLHFHIPLSLEDMCSGPLDSPLLQGLDLKKPWNTASGGERQRILLASVLAKKPRLIILDEPFNHIDKEASELLEKRLSEYFHDHPQSSLIVVSHRPLVKVWSTVRFLEIK